MEHNTTIENAGHVRGSSADSLCWWRAKCSCGWSYGVTEDKARAALIAQRHSLDARLTEKVSESA